jgi:hypothetical protein
MSSCTPTRPERRRARAAALLLTLITVLFPGPAAAAAPVPLPVTAVLVSGGRTSLVVDLSASTGAGRRSVSVTHAGTPQQATLTPVVADGLAIALVVDASAGGAATLPAWLSAAARFTFETPPTTRAVVIADSAPATVTVPPQPGRSGVIRALTALRARGDRDTAKALGLAVRQFPGTAAGRRVVLLYTTAADAGGERAAALAARFRASGTILVVVGTSAGGYWAEAAAGTGGFFAPAGNPVVIPALDQVTATLRGRYLVQFPTPPSLPSRVSVRVETGDLQLTGDTIVAATPAPGSTGAAERSPIRALVLLAGSVTGLAAVLVVVAVLRGRRTPRARPGPSAGDDPDPPERWLVQGRAPVPAPAPVARGRASVPGASRLPPETGPGDP